MRYLLQKDGTPWRDEDGNKIPYTCPKCGARVGVFLKGEPVFLCTGEIPHYLGTVDFESTHVIKHHGIKGMRWGVRKDADYAGVARNASGISRNTYTVYQEGIRRRRSRKSASSRKRALSEAHAMSDDELKRKLARLQNESNYVRLSTEAESIRSGEDKLNRRLDDIGTATIITGAGLSAVAGGIEIYKALHK